MKSRSKYRDKVTVFAASKGERVDAMTDMAERMKRMRSRRHNGQLRGSLGSSVG